MIYKQIIDEYLDESICKRTWKDGNGYFGHIMSPIVAEKLLMEYYKPGYKLMDIGCGLGNILRLSNYIGYKSWGVEINDKLSKYHDGLNVIYGDVLNIDLKFIKDFDILFLYRPIMGNDKSDQLFKLIYDNCKDSVKIIYLSPHEFDLTIYDKFNKIIENKLSNSSHPTDVSINYSILSPIN